MPTDIDQTAPHPQADAPRAPHAPAAPFWRVGPRIHLRRFILIAALALAGFCLFLPAHSLYDYHRPPKKWGVVQDGVIFRSGQIASYRIERALREADIDVVIDLQGFDARDPKHYAEANAIRQLGIENYRFPLAGDGTGDITQYARAIQTIQQARSEGKTVLVHCAAGAQRTGGVVACYRMLIEGKSPEQALAELPRYGWKPHKDQILLDYVNQNMPTLVDQLISRGVLQQRPDPLPQLPTPQG